MTTLVVDSNFLAHRAIYTMNALSYEDDKTGVIFGFLMQILSYAKEFKTNDIIFCWDSTNSKRKELYPDYKANRVKEDITEEEEELKLSGYKQFDTLREEVLPLMGFKNVYFQDGYEADDLIATTVGWHEGEFVIITADHDMYQLLDFADIWNPSSKQLYTYDDFGREWEVAPVDWIDIKSLAGCSSDNIAGIKGVGEKTAAKFIRNELKSTTKAYQKIESARGNVLKRNKPLVTLPFIGTNIYKIKDNKLNFDNFVEHICYRYSFDSFLKDNYYLKWENFFAGRF